MSSSWGTADTEVNVSTQLTNVLHLKSGVGQNITMHALFSAGVSSLSLTSKFRTLQKLY